MITRLAGIITLVVLFVHGGIYAVAHHYSLAGIGILKYSALITGIALVLVLCLFLKNWILHPILRLTDAVKQMELDSLHWVGIAYLSKSIYLKRNDEIGDLAYSFNHMLKDLGEKERIRSMLGKVVSNEVANELLETKIKLEGEQKISTILFLDIRNFTRLSENMSPTDVLLMLNTVFATVAEIIERNHGVVDKYIGDEVMALFGCPIESDYHARDAVIAALEIVDSMPATNKSLEQKGLPTIDIGIGLNTGPVVAGNTGSKARMNYTVIGDTVNLASRFQSLNKEYGKQIIVGEATKTAAPEFNYRFLGEIEIRGRVEIVAIYEPTSDVQVLKHSASRLSASLSKDRG